VFMAKCHDKDLTHKHLKRLLNHSERKPLVKLNSMIRRYKCFCHDGEDQIYIGSKFHIFCTCRYLIMN
jgi:hypothetical protein